MADQGHQLKKTKADMRGIWSVGDKLNGYLVAYAIGVVVLGGLFLFGGLSGWAFWAGSAALGFLMLTGPAVERLVFSSTDLAVPEHIENEQMKFRKRLVEALDEPALFTAPDGRVECANAAAKRRFRFVGEAPILSAVVRRPELLEAVESARATRTRRTFTIVLLDDLDREYACRATPIDTDDGVGVLITMHDLTEVKRVERARADFLANASHELRTPLTSLSGFIETMRGPAKDDREAWDRFLEIMHGQAERMRRLINDLLSLSRIEQNEHRRPDTDADMAAVVCEVVDALDPVAGDKGVSLEVLGEKTGVMVHGVRDELAQVAQNLIDNAVKYSEEGSTVEITIAGGLSRDEAVRLAGRGMTSAARMTISSSPAGTAKSYAVLRIADEGPGIDRKYLPRLSERFYRVDPGRGLRRGTGLGLAIVKHIITRHRGDFLVESLVDVGTAFGVLLPQQVEEAETTPSKGDSGSEEIGVDA